MQFRVAEEARQQVREALESKNKEVETLLKEAEVRVKRSAHLFTSESFRARQGDASN